MTESAPVRVDIWHNILWARYKGVVFSALHKIAREHDADFRFFQIAETDANRKDLTPVDFDVHAYPYTLLFAKTYADIPKVALYWRATRDVWQSDATVVTLAGYNRVEYWLQLIAARIRGKRVCVFCDSTALDRKRSRLKAVFKSLFFNRCEIIFCYGERSRQYVASFGVPSERILVRCQAAALPFDYSVERTVAARIALVASTPRYLYVGRLSEEKDIGVLLAALRQVADRHPDAVLDIVGSGQAEADLRRIAQGLGLDAHVRFLGSKPGDGVWRAYLEATCLILPSRSEPWGLVVNEALSAGCPVIVSDRCGCVPELVIAGQTGFQMRSGDAADLASKMMLALDAFRDTAATATRCIEHIRQFSPELAAQQIYSGATKLLSSR